MKKTSVTESMSFFFRGSFELNSEVYPEKWFEDNVFLFCRAKGMFSVCFVLLVFVPSKYEKDMLYGRNGCKML